MLRRLCAKESDVACSADCGSHSFVRPGLRLRHHSEPLRLEKLIANRTAYIDRIHQSYERGLGNNKVDVIQGFARFVDAHTVEVNGETITADHILIATGGRPSHPDIPGAEYGIDSDGFFELDEMPKRVAVVGAGYIAVEIAGVLNGLGTETHLFVRKHAPLRTFDPLIVETLLEVMNTEGPKLHTESVPKAVIKTPMAA